MSIKKLVNTPELWLSFLEELEREMGDIHRSMEQSRDADERLRLQGEAKAIRKLEKLRDVVNNRK